MQIYIHIPFCELKCKYCRFASIWKLQNLHIEKYVNFLCDKILNFKFKKEKIKTIYFWWWTPSVLTEKQLEKIFNTLKKKFVFDKNIEITIESTPNNITKINLEIWQKFWINRLSIWIQTLNKKSLQEINRWNKSDIENCFYNLENFSNIKNISLDFIIWLPYVKSWEILENIKFILNRYDFLKHISVYMLEEYYNPDKIIETKFDNITYPKDWKNLWIIEEQYLQEYSNIKKYLLEIWFNNYEISNFAKAWFECKHNIWYWNHKEVLAFWMWAWGFLNWKRYLNADNFKDYYVWKKIFEEELNSDDIFLEKLMFWLRTSWIWEDIYNKLDDKKIDFFIKNWYFFKEYDIIKLTNSGILIMDYILKEII